MLMLNLQGPLLDPLVSSSEKSLVIFLHGWGADGDNLVSIGEYWQQSLPSTKFYFPHAPLPCEAGFGYAWFPLSDISNEEKRKNLSIIAPFMEEWIRGLQEKEQVTPNQTFLVGFSQGAMLSLYLGLTYHNLIKGIVAYSGGLIGQESWQNPDHNVSYQLVHGEEDLIVPIEEFYLTEKVLKKYQLTHQALSIQNLSHSIDQEGMLSGLSFIKKLIEGK